ncbi:MAG: hypothetical protein WBG90_21870 [Saonia sp.]
MKNLHFLNMLLLIGVMNIHAQQNPQLNSEKEANSGLFDKDWSDFDNLISGSKGIDQDSTSFQFNFQKPLTNFTFNYRLNSEISKEKSIEMPIFKPSGKHTLEIHQPDSTSHYQLKIFKRD